MRWKRTIERTPAGRLLRASFVGADAAAPLRWALAADTHLCWDPTAARLGQVPDRLVARTVSSIVAADVEACLINGDLAWNEGLREDYRRCRERFEPLFTRLPLALVPGNHDRRERLAAEFEPESVAAEKLTTIVETPAADWILLDSLYRTDVVGGLIGLEQRRLLSRLLAEPSERPAIVVVHHPLGERDGDLLDAPRLLDIIVPARRVKAVVTAHDHVYGLRKREGIYVVELPSAGMPFDPEAPAGWVEARLEPRGATIRMRAADGEDSGWTRLDWRG